MSDTRINVMVLTELPNPGEVWWLEYVKSYIQQGKINLDLESMPDADMSLRSLSTIVLLAKLTFQYFLKYRTYDVIITFQANLVTAWIGLLVRTLNAKGAKHIVLQFHRKEKNNSFSSKFKYWALRFGLGRTAKIICSSSKEIEYYSKILSLPRERFGFIPLCVDPRIVEIVGKEGDYILSAGKTLRDYATLLRAVESLEAKVIIVAGKNSIGRRTIPQHVVVMNDIPYWELIRLMAEAMFLVIPLEDRLISTGQSVAQAAMALGKAVIITKTDGTVDYIIDNATGLFVQPYNHDQLRVRITELLHDVGKRREISVRAKEFVKCNYTIERYLEKLWVELTASITYRR